jgi:hypothetical protein
LPIRNEDLPPVPEDEDLHAVEEGDDSAWGIFDGDDKVMMVEMMNFFRCNSEKKKDSRSCCF